jgi:hypothetical protein
LLKRKRGQIIERERKRKRNKKKKRKKKNLAERYKQKRSKPVGWRGEVAWNVTPGVVATGIKEMKGMVIGTRST